MLRIFLELTTSDLGFAIEEIVDEVFYAVVLARNTSTEPAVQEITQCLETKLRGCIKDS